MSDDIPHGLAQTLRTGDAVNIGDDIVVWVMEARAGTARIVIAAPTDIHITRHPRPTDNNT
jgi:sRNA-binding carbon storage regulator CsrA